MRKRIRTLAAVDPQGRVMHPMGMGHASCRMFFGAFLICLGFAADMAARQEPEATGGAVAYGSGFFDQLRTIFGRFRDADLQRVFREAQPIECPELLGRSGQWRSVAFFNEDRRLGDWCRENLEEVKSDLSVYTFKGSCDSRRPVIQVGTEFPVAESYEAYRQRRIDLDRVDVIVNDPVNAALNPRTKAYTFDLPYLFRDTARPKNLYSFIPPDRHAVYANDVTSRWQCKAVSSKDVTYRFLICRVETAPRANLDSRGQKWESYFGSSAFFILSDGMEAKSSVRFTFEEAK